MNHQQIIIYRHSDKVPNVLPKSTDPDAAVPYRCYVMEVKNKGVTQFPTGSGRVTVFNIEFAL